ncbi:MAG: hypothetical protein IKN34_12125 [Treponema sp.]|nr:hypothetical protein [Treponema sp.]
MKNLIISVILGLFVGLLYIALMLSVSSPLLLLAKFGFIDLFAGSSDIQRFIDSLVSNVVYEGLGSLSLAVIVVQSALCIGAGALAFVFLKSVMKVHLPNEGYFRHLYDAVFFILFLVPEVLLVLSILFNFSLLVTVIAIVIITVLVCAFSIVMSVKVLPDLMKNENRRDILQTN